MNDTVRPWPLTAANIAVLGRQWAATLGAAGVGRQAAADQFEQLVAHYEGGDRFYHSLGHVREVLALVDELVGPTDDALALRLAAWYHDVIYDTRRSDNEEQSGVYAAQALLEVGLAEATVARAVDLILATQHRAMVISDNATRIILDADLAALGAAPQQYRAQSAAIRREYAWVPEADYRAGRSAIMRQFLARERIYHIPSIFERLEQQARRNLSDELAALSSGQK